MKTCPACHTEIIDATSRFCPNCGAPLRSADNPYSTPSPTGTAGDDIGKTNSGFSQPGSSTGNGSTGYTGGFARPGTGSTGYGGGNRGTTPPPTNTYNTGYTGYSGYTPYQPQAAQPSGGLAIAALVCSFLFGIVGLILGIVGLNQYPKGNSYRTMCIVAIVLPIVGFVIAGLLFVVGVAGSAAMY